MFYSSGDFFEERAILEDRLISFSLVLGTVERTHDLEEHLASLDAQTYRSFELIVVDQNKDERLAPILAPYAECFPILHLRSEPGLTRAKNLGLKRVTGDIIGFPDDNYRFPPDLLDRVARFFSEHPRVDGLTGHSVDEDGNNSNGKFDTEAGVIDKFNVWYRSTAYTIFLRRDGYTEPILMTAGRDALTESTVFPGGSKRGGLSGLQVGWH